MTTLMNDLVYAGLSTNLDPILYDERVAGYGFSLFDLFREDPQPRVWRAGEPLSWPEIWLGVE